MQKNITALALALVLTTAAAQTTVTSSTVQTLSVHRVTITVSGIPGVPSGIDWTAQSLMGKLLNRGCNITTLNRLPANSWASLEKTVLSEDTDGTVYALIGGKLSAAALDKDQLVLVTCN